MLAQVILIVRAPFKGQGAVGAQEGTYSSVDTLMDLWADRNSDVKSLSHFHCPHRILFYEMNFFDLSPGAERSA